MGLFDVGSDKSNGGNANASTESANTNGLANSSDQSNSQQVRSSTNSNSSVTNSSVVSPNIQSTVNFGRNEQDYIPRMSADPTSATKLAALDSGAQRTDTKFANRQSTDPSNQMATSQKATSSLADGGDIIMYVAIAAVAYIFFVKRK